MWRNDFLNSLTDVCTLPACALPSCPRPTSVPSPLPAVVSVAIGFTLNGLSLVEAQALNATALRVAVARALGVPLREVGPPVFSISLARSLSLSHSLSRSLASDSFTSSSSSSSSSSSLSSLRRRLVAGVRVDMLVSSPSAALTPSTPGAPLLSADVLTKELTKALNIVVAISGVTSVVVAAPSPAPSGGPFRDTSSAPFADTVPLVAALLAAGVLGAAGLHRWRRARARVKHAGDESDAAALATAKVAPDCLPAATEGGEGARDDDAASGLWGQEGREGEGEGDAKAQETEGGDAWVVWDISDSEGGISEDSEGGTDAEEEAQGDLEAPTSPPADPPIPIPIPDPIPIAAAAPTRRETPRERFHRAFASIPRALIKRKPRRDPAADKVAEADGAGGRIAEERKEAGGEMGASEERGAEAASTTAPESTARWSLVRRLARERQVRDADASPSPEAGGPPSLQVRLSSLLAQQQQPAAAPLAHWQTVRRLLVEQTREEGRGRVSEGRTARGDEEEEAPVRLKRGRGGPTPGTYSNGPSRPQLTPSQAARRSKKNSSKKTKEGSPTSPPRQAEGGSRKLPWGELSGGSPLGSVSPLSWFSSPNPSLTPSPSPPRVRRL